MARKTKKEEAVPVLVAWCIDRSGSMQGMEDDTIGGFNAFVKEQKDLPGEMLLSLVLFDTTFQAPIVAMDIREVPPLDRSTYYIGGGTSLYDAVGVTISGVEGWLANNPEFKGLVNVQVWTDGGENSSSRWSKYCGGLQQMMDKVREKQAEGWVFSFLGSGGAAWTEGENFQAVFSRKNTTQFANNAAGTRMSYATASAGVKGMRSSGSYTSNSVSLDNLAADAATLTSYGINSAEEALAGTDNSSE